MADALQALSPRASISLQLMARTVNRPEGAAEISRPLTMSRMSRADATPEETFVPIIIEIEPGTDIGATLRKAGARDVEELTKSFISASIPLSKAADVYGHAAVRYVESVKEKSSLMERALVEAAVGLPSGRTVRETGQGVVVGIVDSGFDLSHPAFRDDQGRLRVDALLDQKQNREFSASELEVGWQPGGSRPGADEDGHGTHVASIAAATQFGQFSGVAPNARLVLVRTCLYR